MGQLSLYDFIDPDYKNSSDEIVRASAETDLELHIKLNKCCNTKPKAKFISCKEYWVSCPVCGSKTKVHKKCYQAMQAWNTGERETV